jgi:Family of unknown function (DUF6065)/Cupin-like domain
MDHPRLDVEIYQIADDSMLKKNRTDGTGWDWCWADWQRDWMDATPFRYAYRCLPLTIMNQTGWWIKNPVGFTAVWRGGREPGTIDFRFDAAAAVWSQWINSQFGEGIVTWNTPFLFRTKPEGSRLLVCGPANYFKTNAHPLMALIESDWISMSFTMNWKLMTPGVPVRFELGEPLFQAIPVAANVCADLQAASVSYQKLAENPELHATYMEWDHSRRRFHDQKIAGEVKGNDWQKDYFQGRDATGREAPSYHMTKVRAPEIEFSPSTQGAAYSTASGAANGRENARRPVAESGPPASAERPYAPAEAGTAASHVAEEAYASGYAQPVSAVRDRPDEPESNPFQFQAFVSTATIEAVELELEPDEPDWDDDDDGSMDPSPPQTPAQTHAAGAHRVDDEWRRWLTENLLVGQPPEGIVDAMVSSGFDRDESIREVNLAIESHYFKGVELLRNRLMKRDWLMAVYRKCNRLHPASTEVERRHKLPRDEFLREYYSTNRPVIITGMMDDWPAMTKWNLDYFASNFGDREVEVQMGRTMGANYEIEREKFIAKIKFGDFVEKVRTAGQTNDFYLTANNNSANRSVLPELWDDIVQIPEYLSSQNPGGFFWMGPAGTITPFHHDLTNNFMAQVIGRKRLKIAPSWDMPLMLNYRHCFSQVDGRVAPAAPQPPVGAPQILEFVLHAGEILFLPIGCLHFVEGLDISVTVSFTNFVFDNDFSSFYTTFGPV